MAATMLGVKPFRLRLTSEIRQSCPWIGRPRSQGMPGGSLSRRQIDRRPDDGGIELRTTHSADIAVHHVAEHVHTRAVAYLVQSSPVVVPGSRLASASACRGIVKRSESARAHRFGRPIAQSSAAAAPKADAQQASPTGLHRDVVAATSGIDRG